MWGQPGSADVTGVSAGLASSVMGSMPVITMAEIPRPAVPSVLNVNDRAVYVDNIEAPPPGYVLARRWMRNDPETDVESLPHPPNTLVLPRPHPPVTASADETPVFPDDSEDYDPEEAVKALKRHWVNVRRYDTEQRHKNLERFRDRLKAITSTGVNPVNAAAVQQLLAHQQQQHLLHQQQQAIQGMQAAAAAQGRLPPAQQQQQMLAPGLVAPGLQQAAAPVVQQQQQPTESSAPAADAATAAVDAQQEQQGAAVLTTPAAVSTEAPVVNNAAEQQHIAQQQQQLEQQQQQGDTVQLPEQGQQHQQSCAGDQPSAAVEA